MYNDENGEILTKIGELLDVDEIRPNDTVVEGLITESQQRRKRIRSRAAEFTALASGDYNRAATAGEGHREP